MCEIYKNLSLEDLSGEIWKDIPGYEGLYQVSNMGRIKSIANKEIKFGVNQVNSKIDKIIKQLKNGQGYLRIGLSKNNKQIKFSVHRLVAQTFIPNPENKTTVNHKNEIKTDNRVENLEWMSNKENNNWGTRIERISKKKCKPVLQYDLNGNLIQKWESATEAKKKKGYNNKCISRCCLGERKTYKGYIWRYEE